MDYMAALLDRWANVTERKTQDQKRHGRVRISSQPELTMHLESEGTNKVVTPAKLSTVDEDLWPGYHQLSKCDLPDQNFSIDSENEADPPLPMGDEENFAINYAELNWHSSGLHATQVSVSAAMYTRANLETTSTTVHTLRMAPRMSHSPVRSVSREKLMPIVIQTTVAN